MGMGRKMAHSSIAMRLCALGTMLLGVMSDSMPAKAPAPMSRKLLSSRATATFNQMAQQNQKFAGCSCDSCRGMVGRPPAESSGHDTVSLLTCRATTTEGACGDEFCESSCKVQISSVPDANPKCHKKEVASEGLSLAQMREVTRLRTQCPPPQGCSCLCKCPEIVWPPMLPLPFMVPTPQPFFGGGASLLEENAVVEHKTVASQTSPPSLLQVGQSQEHKDSAGAAAAAAQAAMKEDQAAAAAAAEAEEKVVSFEVEVVGYDGMKLPEKTTVEISGFCESPVTSDELQAAEDEAEPKWVFGGAKTTSFTKVFQQGLLKEMAANYLVLTISNPADKQVVGTAKFTLEGLIHDSTSVSLIADVEWGADFIAKYLEEHTGGKDEAAAATEEGEKPEEPEEVVAPEPGHMAITVNIEAPPGRSLAPVDYEDWVVLTVKNEGVFSLPTKLIEINPTPIVDSPAGHIADHPLSYSVRVLGCSFDGGKIVKPELEEEEQEAQVEGTESPKPQSSVQEPPADGEETSRERAGTMDSKEASVSGGSGNAVQQQQGVTYERFIDGLTKIGYPNAPEDGAELWKLLNKSEAPAIYMSDWVKLGEIGVPADRQAVLSFREWLLDKYKLLKDAFDAMDGDSKGFINEEEFTKTLADLEYPKDDVAEIFQAIDTKHEGTVSWEDFQCLHLFKALDAVERVGKVKKWMLLNIGPMMKCMQIIDDNASGRVSFGEWEQAMERLKYPDLEDAKLAFYFMDVALMGMVGPKEFHFFEKFDSKEFLKELQEFQGFLKERTGNMEIAFQEIAAIGADGKEVITPKKWQKGMKRFGYQSSSGMDTRAIYNFLDDNHTGSLSKSEFMLLRAFNCSAAKGGLARIKAFFTSRFAKLSDAYDLMFSDPSEFFRVAEAKLPHIQFDNSEVRSYRGREWLQNILNTLGDPRGRKLAKKLDSVIGGSWAYFFPKPANIDQKIVDEKGGLYGLVDYKESPDVELARVARWHHSQTFVDLRQLKAEPDCTKLELRCFLSQVGPMPKEITESATELPKGPFESCRTYVKLTISFDRHLEHLCPRNIPDLPNHDGQTPFIPGAPEPKPPPTVLEEFERQVRDIVGKLTEKFALQCLHQGLEQSQVVGPNNKMSQYLLLGKGLDRGQFLLWLRSAQQGKLWEDLATALRPAAVKVIRECASDGPASGLYGDDKDARYSELRDLFMTHIMKAINTDINLQGYQREAKTWKNPPLFGDGDENFFEQEDIVIQQQEMDKKLKRLSFECEMYGEFDRATRMFGERLSLPQNKENFTLWVQYARFLMRTQQKQPEAEEALRFAISLVSLEHADANAVLFLACILMNRSLPCSLSNEPRELRFNAALKLLTIVLERDPTDKAANFFMYLIYAMEVKEVPDPEVSQSYLTKSLKYLALSQMDKNIMTGSLPSLDDEGDPYFPELEDLVSREIANRSGGKSEVQEHEVPPAWTLAKHDAYPTVGQVHLLPKKKDEAALQSMDRLLLFGMPVFTRYLILEAAPEHGFLTPATVESERCQLQLVKTLMMLGQYEDAVETCTELLSVCDRLCEAYLLLGEAYYRLAMKADPEAKKQMYTTSLEKFKAALGFLSEPKEPGHHNKQQDVEVNNKDPVIHIRVASIYYSRAEESGWTDLQTMTLAKEHYKCSLLLCPTAEGWRNSGVCAFRSATLKKAAGLSEEEDALFQEAMECLTQANLMDETRPKINAWLAICAVELGKSTIARQAFRQTMAKEDELDFDTAMELASRLLHFSDIKNSEYEGGEDFVRPGLYAKEALIAARAALMKQDSGDAHFIIGQALMMLGDDKEAMGELRGAIAWFYDQPERQQQVADVARTCAARIIDEPRMMEVVDEDLQMASERRKVGTA
eukprot:gnl/MRDRNA2_/MRDRNA2_94345_c0_seq1.p1 gnl/MRDRNA2_/MRDRNA2_94345_c0~~gnl/MRDRNA2_/MRDRNA2_94345_c0_seq1.p1  ORF type:complete len:1865 (+),score=454.65 gnl/MRDRNA2_/MRDRNA2_94345_c0_seq1:62-5656(+)